MWWLLGVLAVLVALMPRRAIAYVAGNPVMISVAPIGDGQELRVDAAGAYNAMKAAAARDGVTLRANSGYRSTEKQAELTDTRKDYAAPVNRSPHQVGIAVDIESAGGTNDAYRWLLANARRFGFRPHAELYPKSTVKEPWHWEYRP